jgi:hypothetical protein
LHFLSEHDTAWNGVTEQRALYTCVDMIAMLIFSMKCNPCSYYKSRCIPWVLPVAGRYMKVVCSSSKIQDSALERYAACNNKVHWDIARRGEGEKMIR